VGHCFYDYCRNVLTIFLPLIFFYCLQHILWSTGGLGWLTGRTNDWISTRWGCFQKHRHNHRRATWWCWHSVPYGLISRCKRRPHCCPPRFERNFFPKLVFKKTHSLETREIVCSLILCICTSFKIWTRLALSSLTFRWSFYTNIEWILWWAQRFPPII